MSAVAAAGSNVVIRLARGSGVVLDTDQPGAVLHAHPLDVLASGSLGPASAKGKPDQYVYDPRDVSIAAVEAAVDPASLTDQRWIHATRGKQLVYHTAPFERDTELSGFFKLSAWLAIDQPDTDFGVLVYEY